LPVETQMKTHGAPATRTPDVGGHGPGDAGGPPREIPDTGAGRPASTVRAPVHRGRLGGGGGPLAAAARHAPRRVELALTRGGNLAGFPSWEA